MKSDHDRALGTQRRYDLDELRNKLKRAGFEVLRGTYANSLLFPVVAVRRLLLKPLGLADKGSDVKPLPQNLQWLNRIFTNALVWEARRLGDPKARLPMGLSVICVAKRPDIVRGASAQRH
jgi:hypothetical protein